MIAMSRLSLKYFLVPLLGCNLVLAQQKANDFTKRLGFLEGKQSRLSGRFFSSPRLSEAYSKRIKIQEWPKHFSPFGGKRYTTNDIQGLITKRVPLKQVERADAVIPGRVLGEEKRAPRLNYEDRYTSTATVEFRDAYYAKLNQRMDEWMEKVNNLSLRDVNRFQFRKGRSAEPGFPVQRAGSDLSEVPPNRLPSPGSGTLPKLSTEYRIGPRAKSSVQSNPVKVPTRTVSPQIPSSSIAPDKKDTPPIPKLGPKKIRVQVRPIVE